MKNKFSTYDIVCCLTELQRLVGMRVNQVYDIDHKTYLIKLQRTEEKVMLLIESGCRFHTTAFEWPKNMAPSGFSMKMRKHLRNKRLEVLKQMGMDRIVDLQFGTGEAAYHVILELYDRGNIVLTDYELTILNVLRPHTEGDKIRFAVREKYPVDRVHQRVPPPTGDQLREILSKAKPGESLKKILNPHLEYGPAVIDHMLLKVGLPLGVKLGKGFDLSQVDKISEALQVAEALLDQALQQPSKGYIIQKAEKRQNKDGESDELITNQEFHPYLFLQVANQLYKEFDSFDLAVDEFFSQMEAQKIDVKALHQEKEALKKLENVRKDHQDRLLALQQTQEVDKQKAELILRNQELVESCLLVVRTALANQLPWPAIDQLISEARGRGDPVAQAITKLKLETNHISLTLTDPFSSEDTDNDSDMSEDEEKITRIQPMTIDIDLALTSFANAKKYYDKKRSAAKKQQKTVESAGKALKSAEKKTKQTLKEVQAMSTITKARKVFWFEKFFWFISSENYLVIAGRDQTQNEHIVKRYLRGSDVYVHADLHGASSVVVKNPTSVPVPPKTLNEAGVMAICYSAAWEAKVTTSAWWVHADQVSKTAPTGEYLTTGSFMIRGKKNYLPPCHLVMGFGFLFKLEESSIERHKDERKVRGLEEDHVLEEAVNNTEDVELELSDEELPEEKSGLTLEDVEEEDGDKPHFPDTQIRVDHTSDNKVSVTAAMGSLDLSGKTGKGDEEAVVYLGDDQPMVIKPAASNSCVGSRVSVTAAMGSLKLSGKTGKGDEEAVVYLGDDQPVVIKPAASNSCVGSRVSVTAAMGSLELSGKTGKGDEEAVVYLGDVQPVVIKPAVSNSCVGSRVSVTAAMGSLKLSGKTGKGDEEAVVYLGDDQPVVIKPAASNSCVGSRVSVTAAMGSLKLSGKTGKGDEEAVVYLGDDQPVVIKPAASNSCVGSRVSVTAAMGSLELSGKTGKGDEEAVVYLGDVQPVVIKPAVSNSCVGSRVSVTAAMGSLDLSGKTGKGDEEAVVYLGDDQPVVIKPAAPRQKQQKHQKQAKNTKLDSDTKLEEKEDAEEKDKQNISQVKRGQKGKLKKIKEKYKDQDEEERKLRMQILQSAGSGKAKDTKKAKKNAPKPAPAVRKPVGPKPPTKPVAGGGSGGGEKDAGGESGGEEEGEGDTVTADVDMLDSLTGQPLPEDELLFAVPVVAPYNTLVNYKYKVKLTPGTGKRGKATKTALNMFLKDRNATNHERDLMRSVKDQNMARNLPGKVKVSAPQLQKLKK